MRSCLIVDGSVDERAAVEGAVRAAGKGVGEFHEAADAETALQVFRERKPDIVFLDMELAGDVRAGEGLGGLLRAMLAQRPHAPVVLLARASEPDVVGAMNLGAIAALRRPLSADAVKQVLESIEPERARMDYFA